MALVDTPTPKLDIHESARSSVRDVYFDDWRYTNYLHERGASEERIAGLKLAITNEGISPVAVANFGRDGDDYLIRFSAQRMPRNIKGQNNTLFHETEHFIWEGEHPHARLAKAAVVVGSLASGALFFGANGGQATFDATDGLPIILQGVATLAGGITSGLLMGMGTMFAANGLYQELSPNEINARIAARRETRRNPELLEISFKH